MVFCRGPCVCRPSRAAETWVSAAASHVFLPPQAIWGCREGLQHESLDLSLCSQITDESLGHVARIIGNGLHSINLSKLWTFTHLGIAKLVERCQSLAEVDLSNCTEFSDYAAEAIGHAQNLKSLKLVKCKQITDMGLGCIAVGCRKLQTLNLKWCVGVTDLGVELVAVKCKELRNLDLSYLQFIGACNDPLNVIVTELLPGMSLRKYMMNLRPNRIDLHVAISFALDIAQAMDCLHANGIIHRDLKPGNLLGLAPNY